MNNGQLILIIIIIFKGLVKSYEHEVQSHFKRYPPFSFKYSPFNNIPSINLTSIYHSDVTINILRDEANYVIHINIFCITTYLNTYNKTDDA